ncbi:MAG: PQQ-binding-like beta-propeller repeat protein [bacterium]
MFIILFILNVTSTYGVWPKYGGTLENTHFQWMKGAMSGTPDVKWSYVTGSGVESFGPTVADIDADGSIEVIVGSLDSKVYSINGSTGIPKWSYATGISIYSSTAVADINGNIEVVVCGGSELYCINGANGILKWSCTAGGGNSSPAIADVDKDGNYEVVVGSNDHKVYCLNGSTGSPKWSYTTGGGVYSSPAVADIDGDLSVEVVIGSDDKVYSLNGLTGIPEWSYATGGQINSSPAIADLDGDGSEEVVVGSNDYKVYCLNGSTGIPKWNYTTGSAVESSPAIADVDGDGSVEVVVGSNDHKVYCLNGSTGIPKWSYFAPGQVHRSPSIADIDGDNKIEVLVPNYNTASLISLNGENGSLLWAKTLASDVHDITIADIDGDDCVELVVGTYHDNKLWVLDDMANATGCGPFAVEEQSTVNNKKLTVTAKSIKDKIYLSLQNSAFVKLSLYDITGRLLNVIYDGSLSSGSYTFTPTIKHSGIYFAILKADNATYPLKIIKF